MVLKWIGVASPMKLTVKNAILVITEFCRVFIFLSVHSIFMNKKFPVAPLERGEVSAIPKGDNTIKKRSRKETFYPLVSTFLIPRTKRDLKLTDKSIKETFLTANLHPRIDYHFMRYTFWIEFISTNFHYKIVSF